MAESGGKSFFNAYAKWLPGGSAIDPISALIAGGLDKRDGDFAQRAYRALGEMEARRAQQEAEHPYLTGGGKALGFVTGMAAASAPSLLAAAGRALVPMAATGAEQMAPAIMGRMAGPLLASRLPGAAGYAPSAASAAFQTAPAVNPLLETAAERMARFAPALRMGERALKAGVRSGRMQPTPLEPMPEIPQFDPEAATVNLRR